MSRNRSSIGRGCVPRWRHQAKWSPTEPKHQDVDEKRGTALYVTDLYVKAVDQLGSDKAPIRIGGLYALERLAQDNRVQRQSIVEVICAYLRMPYTPPDDHPTPDNSGLPSSIEGAHTQPQSHSSSNIGNGSTDEPTRNSSEERQVRLTAQRILARHLQPRTHDATANPLYWGPEMVLDLTEATLVNLDFTGCHLHNATFTSATFAGDAKFDEATFTGVARFEKATFACNASFGEATFSGLAWFSKTTFTGYAWFGKATFAGNVSFGRATFTGYASFSAATFGSDATFAGSATFGKARFTSNAFFDATNFGGEARFGEAKFGGEARFAEATFGAYASFNRTEFASLPVFKAAFQGLRSFEGATANGSRYDGPAAE
ncbi:pentapeptide repeat-containing protein [Micromonospora sp. CPCC 205556]|uniref:pentapeptide repeat-containing protein n=1 Tax=Micromonospora sp. CPCC 205556 TaxID=3122398 RepID=UPI002FEFDF34